MASIIIFLLISAFSMTEAKQKQSNITLGSSLKPTTNSSWRSPSGLYAFGFYKQGNGYAVGIFLAGIPEKTVVWTANRDDPPVSSNATLLFTSDGKLVLQTTEGQQTYVADDSSLSASSASLSDSGNFVLYNPDQEIIWQSFDKPTDTILPGQPLQAGAELHSSVSEADQSTGIFSLTMQHDGNLVLYSLETPRAVSSAYWATNTDRSGDNVTLNLDADGHLYLLNATGINILNLTPGGYPTEGTIYLMRIDAGGLLRLYSKNLTNNGSWSIVWNPSSDKCDPKGLCGFNGFCVLNDQDADCRCLPGFAKVKEGNQTSGCERNFTAESCKSNGGYRIEQVANTIWEDDSYSVLSQSTVKDCEAACLEDCTCEVAMFKDTDCKKQKIPLKHGRRDLSDSNIVLVKVRILSSTVEPKLELSERKKEDQKVILIISVSLIAFALIILAIAGVLIHRNHVGAYKKLSGNGNNRLIEDVAPISFTYAELEKVTNNFKVEVGRGSFGTVYKGEIMNGEKVVAVKRLDRVSTDGEREFQTEIKIIGRTHHRNLVRLLGYCLDGANRLLVYDYMSNGSLADVLFTPEKQPCWNARTEIARNIARGLLYLHEECETQIIHCDIKPQNILMDEYWHARIADFGLAKLLKADQTRTLTGIRGTKGYVAPEWHKKLPVTVKADVYSFGIVLLEIICCRQSVNWSLWSVSEEEAVLEQWVEECFKVGDLCKLVGDEEVDKRQLERMVKVGLWCILEEPSLRPSMKKVLLMLEGTVDIPIPPSSTFFSAI